MLIDLLSQDNYINFNIKVAKILGLQSAIYLSEIMNINSKAIKKNKVDNNYFTIDRKYIEDRTTLDESTQLDIQKKLINIGILELNQEVKNSINLNLTVLTSILMNPDEKLVTSIKLAAKKKSTKQEAIVENLKSNIVCKNEELRNAYEEWIDSVIAKQGWMSKKSITAGQKLMDEFTEMNLDLALKILEIASINGYRDIQWAIDNYKSNYKIKYVTKPVINQSSPVELSQEVF